MNSISIPSLVGIGETDLGLLSLGELGRHTRSGLPHRVTFDGATYLVGEGLARFARPIERMDLQRLGDGPEARALTFTTLGLLLGQGQHTASLIIGLPVEVMSDRQAALQILSALRSWLKGEHRFEVDQGQVFLNIAAINVMAQPAGAFFAWGLDGHGRWMRSIDDLKAPVGICDLGFNTLDVFSVEGGQVVASFTGGDTLGMRRAAEVLARAVKTHHGVRLSLHEADALLRDRRPELHTSSGKVDLSATVRQVLDAAAGQVVAFLESRWGNGRQFAHLLAAGGGALSIKDVLLHTYPHLVVLPEPVSANAVGLTRYARRAFKGAELVIGLDPGFGAFKAAAIS